MLQRYRTFCRMPFIIVGTKPFRDPNRLTELPRETPFQQYPQA